MDLQFFWNILNRRKWLILAVMAITAIAAYFFVGQLDPKYKSNAQFSTGIIDFKGLNPEEDIFYLQKFSVEISFGNLIELMKSDRNMRPLTFRLLLHDLEEGVIPFKEPDYEELAKIPYTKEEEEQLKEIMRANLENLEYAITDPRMNKLYRHLANCYAYDPKTLMEDHMVIERVNDTDYIHVEFVSNSPEFSLFACEKYTADFLRNYDSLQKEEDNESVVLLKEQVEEKEKAYLAKKSELDAYRSNKNLIDLSSQQQAVVTQQTELELQRQTAFEKIAPLEASIADLDRRLAKMDRNSSTARVDKGMVNTAILTQKRRLKNLRLEYQESGYTDKNLERQIQLYENELKNQIERLATLEPQTDEDELDRSQDDFLAQKVDLEIELRRAKGAVATLDDELRRLSSRGAGLVSSEALVDRMEQDYEILFEEYKSLNAEYSTKKIDLSDSSYPVKLVNPAQLAEQAEPNHRSILAAFSGMLSGMMCVVLIFFLAFLDLSLSNPHQFQKFTSLVALGSVNKVNDKAIDIGTLFQHTSKNKKEESFKESLRNIRYQIESSGAQKFLFTSTNTGEGKTFLIVHLAHVLTLKNKKVLLIDANFKNNSLTQMSKQDLEQGLLNSRLIGENDLGDDFMTQSPNNTKFNLKGVDIIGNKGTNQSPSEVFAGKDFHNFIQDLSKSYDYIFMESAAMNDYSDTKELVEYTDKVIAVFSAESSIKHSDKENISFLQGLGNRFMGAILNKVDLKNIN